MTDSERGTVPDDAQQVRELLKGNPSGATLWALRMQVKRDFENGTQQLKQVPYGVVLAYAEQAATETAESYIETIRAYKFKLIYVASTFTALGALFGWLASGAPI
jgi:O6-methylguanine-DNA--protein-cysteine methyltransferase